MDAQSYAGWSKVYNEYLKSGKSKEEFCKDKGLTENYFNRQCRKSETFEKKTTLREAREQEAVPSLENLFVELVAEPEEILPGKQSNMKILYRGVEFELNNSFDESIFQRVLNSIREVL